MKKVVQINTVANSGSTGRIAEEIGKCAIAHGWESYVAYGRGNPVSASHLIRVGTDMDMRWHGLETRLLDNHGLSSRRATRAFVRRLREIKPDIVHLHNIHGYYLNYEILFDYLAEEGVPVVWTLHDCWSFTGHCSHFIFTKCEQWKSGCLHCAHKRVYPGAVCLSRSAKNYKDKRESFTKPANVTMVPVSHWMEGLLKDSFLNGHKVHCISNGVDVEAFAPLQDRAAARRSLGIGEGRKLILGVSSVWNDSKGLKDFGRIRALLPQECVMVLVGMSPVQARNLPDGITGLGRTRNQQELARWYAAADVFVNPTHADTFPTVNMEALACGTPVVTYAGTGGSEEQVDKLTGRVVPEGDISAMVTAIEDVVARPEMREACRERALRLYNNADRFSEYVDLYEEILRNK